MGIFNKKKEDKATEVASQKDAKKSVSKNANNSQHKEVMAYGVILFPIITEKTHNMIEGHKYTFRVERKATKQQIKKVVEKVYGVRVLTVNTVVTKPKRRTVKYDRGYQKMYKKAIVTVHADDHITLFEGA